MSRIISQEEVSKVFKYAGCELLEVYTKAKNPVKFRCSCGNISRIRYDHFKNGSRCIKCAGERTGSKKRISFDLVSKYFDINGCKLLSDVYCDSKQHLDYICNCGEISKISFNNFKKGHRCMSCRNKRMTGSKNPKWNSDRETVRLNIQFGKRCNWLLRSSLESIGAVKSDKCKNLLGYTVFDLKKHIMEHPQWNNVRNDKWNIDHIFPIKAFVKYRIFDLKVINCLDNLQPLSARENQSKNDKYDAKEFEDWLTSKNISFSTSFI